MGKIDIMNGKDKGINTIARDLEKEIDEKESGFRKWAFWAVSQRKISPILFVSIYFFAWLAIAIF